MKSNQEVRLSTDRCREQAITLPISKQAPTLDYKRNGDLDEAAGAADAYACPTQPPSEIRHSGVEQLSLWGYDEAILEVWLRGETTNSNVSLVRQVLYLPITSKPKSIETP